MNVDPALLAEIRHLVSVLNIASQAYYGGMGEKMSDYEWDSLFDRLKVLELQTGVVLPDSPTINVSYSESTNGVKEAHEYAALSLAKTKQVDDLVKWAENRAVWLSWKLDGLTLVATYDQGRLSRLVTRGDGHIGTVVTHLASAIHGVPLTIAEKGHLVIRGEAVISYTDFQRFITESGEDYANPRNLASGTMTLKNPDEVRPRNVHWIPFTLVAGDNAPVAWGARMDWLRELGFSPVEREMFTEAETIAAGVERWTEKVTQLKNPYPVDGLVLCYDDTEYAATGSVTGHHATRAGIAFKWQDESVQTELDHIEWSCAVNTISPVAVFRPVKLEGTTVKRASLCNISECERLGIGDSGSVLEVIKANKIIPKVIAVNQKKGELKIPANCPVCNAPTEIYSSPNGTKSLRCTNQECTARQLRRFMRFVSIDCMNIDGLAEETLSRFINCGWLHTVADIYRLGQHRDEIAELDGFGEKSANNLVAAIEKSRNCSSERLLFALTIPLCGIDVAKRLLSYKPLRELIDEAKTADADVFSTIDGIGPAKSEAFVKWCHNATNIALLEDLLQELKIADYQPPAKTGSCAGKNFVITGDLLQFANRAAMKKFIEENGGKVSGSVSGKTDFLINNDANSGSGKNKKAKELNIPVITEAEFIRRFKENHE